MSSKIDRTIRSTSRSTTRSSRLSLPAGTLRRAAGILVRAIDLIEQADPLVDAFSRPITYLRISVTDKCNLRCVYCMPEAGLPWMRRDEILSYEEIAAIVARGRQGRRAKHPPHRRRAADPPRPRPPGRRHRRDPGIDDIALSTNGLLLEEQLAELAAAGLRRVNISLDTLRDGSIRSDRAPARARPGAARDRRRDRRRPRTRSKSTASSCAARTTTNSRLSPS